MSDALLNVIPRIRMDTVDTLVGWRGEIPVTRKEFLERVSSWHTLLADLAGQNYALFAV